MPGALRTADFIGTLGVNTHIDFAAYGYQNLSVVEASIHYLGLENLRDSPQWAGDLDTWRQVAAATGAKFDAYIPEGSPANMHASLDLMPQLANEGILNYIEGGNEEDDAYAAQLGNTLQITAQFQQQVYQVGHSLGLPVINMSFGAGWTATNDWQGDYGSVGDLSAYADYGNAHTYPNVGQGTDWSIQRVNSLAKLADSRDPVITTEIGWNRTQGFSQQAVAKFALDATMDGIKAGDVKMYFYALFDDGAGQFGLMNQNGTPMPAGQAIHNLTTLLSDTGASASTFTTGSLSYSLSNTTSNDSSLLMEKSNGTYWISLWNEVDPAHDVTLALANPATDIKVFDPLTGTNATKDITGQSSVTVRLTDHPLLIEVFPSKNTPPPPPPPPPSLQPNDLVVNVPAIGDTVTAGSMSALAGVSVADPWAAQAPGLMALNLWDNSGALLYVNGQQVTGTLSLTLDQINADLAGLAYSAGAAGSDTVTVDVWNQAGVEATKSFGVTIAEASSPPQNTVTIAPNDANPVVLDSNVTISATSGDHMLFIGGTHDVALLTGGTEQVQAYQGYNRITTGAGNDTIRIGGSGNVIDAGSGLNAIADSGSANTLVMPGKGLDDVLGYVLQNGDSLDFRAALNGTAWNGQQSTLGGFLHVSMSGNDAIIAISNIASGAAVGTMRLHDSGPLSMDGLLAHSII